MGENKICEITTSFIISKRIVNTFTSHKLLFLPIFYYNRVCSSDDGSRDNCNNIFMCTIETIK